MDEDVQALIEEGITQQGDVPDRAWDCFGGLALHAFLNEQSAAARLLGDIEAASSAREMIVMCTHAVAHGQVSDCEKSSAILLVVARAVGRETISRRAQQLVKDAIWILEKVCTYVEWEDENRGIEFLGAASKLFRSLGRKSRMPIHRDRGLKQAFQVLAMARHGSRGLLESEELLQVCKSIARWREGRFLHLYAAASLQKTKTCWSPLGFAVFSFGMLVTSTKSLVASEQLVPLVVSPGYRTAMCSGAAVSLLDLRDSQRSACYGLDLVTATKCDQIFGDGSGEQAWINMALACIGFTASHPNTTTRKRGWTAVRELFNALVLPRQRFQIAKTVLARCPYTSARALLLDLLRGFSLCEWDDSDSPFSSPEMVTMLHSLVSKYDDVEQCIDLNLSAFGYLYLLHSRDKSAGTKKFATLFEKSCALAKETRFKALEILKTCSSPSSSLPIDSSTSSRSIDSLPNTPFYAPPPPPCAKTMLDTSMLVNTIEMLENL